MKKILELSGIILACVLVPYLIASLLEWGFIVKEWNNATKIVLGMCYMFIVPFAVCSYFVDKSLR